MVLRVYLTNIERGGGTGRGNGEGERGGGTGRGYITGVCGNGGHCKSTLEFGMCLTLRSL